jgi:hypothetical protein
MKFRLRLVDGETEIKSIMASGQVPPAGVSVMYEGQQWFASAPAWVLEGKQVLQIVTLSQRPTKKLPKRREPTHAPHRD